MTLDELAPRAGEPFAAPRGAVLLRGGEVVEAVPYTAEGRIRVFRVAPRGREGTLYVLPPRTICVVSALGALSGVPAPAEAVAEDAVRGWRVPAAALRAAVAADGALRAAIFAAAAERMAALVGLIDTVQFHGIEARLAEYLLDRAVVLPGNGGHGRLAMTHERIAADLWTAREVVSRSLKSFEHRGWLRLERGMIVVEDPEALARLLDG